jgi:8-oxo-dGTP pyrophosphatase MutT (NUDIX family)
MPPNRVQSLKPRTQLAAMPWRRSSGQLEVLMVTSRVSRHWLIPKGWPMKGKPDKEAAAIEAFEEAGVKGRMSASPIGSYRYDKLLPDGGSIPCQVKVYGLEVISELDTWPEERSRERRWTSLAAAAADAYEPGLSAFLTGLLSGSLDALSRGAKRR